MLKEKGAESLQRIEAKLKMPRKFIAGRLKKKIVSELTELRKALVAGLTQAKEAIQSLFASNYSGYSSSSHAVVQKHFDKLWGAVSRLGMLDLTTKAYSKGLITAEVKDSVFSVNGVSSGVKADALLSEPPYQHLAEKLKIELLC